MHCRLYIFFTPNLLMSTAIALLRRAKCFCISSVLRGANSKDVYFELALIMNVLYVALGFVIGCLLTPRQHESVS